MNLGIGIIGLEQSGRTTIFTALTAGSVPEKGHGPTSAHVGTARVADPRLDGLTRLLQPKRTVPASIIYTDIGASVKSLAADKGIGGQLLNQLGNADAIINVVRAFEDERVPHPAGSVNVERDIAAMNLELAFSDMAIIERRLERLQESLKAAKAAERQAHQREQDLLAKLRAGLEKETPIRELGLSPEETREISHFQFLTAKPLLLAVNIGEEQVGEAAGVEDSLNATYSHPGCRVVTICGKLEAELASLDPSDAREMRAGYGMSESGVDRLVAASFKLMGLVSFFTMASGEVRAWPVPGGTEAMHAAGRIHTDMERGFIRAEVLSYDDLVGLGSVAEARKRGLLRIEGKNYTVQDGDVITFLFNV